MGACEWLGRFWIQLGFDLEIRSQKSLVGDVEFCYGDISGARSLLGFAPGATLREDLKSLVCA
jgi:hypothetical protein